HHRGACDRLATRRAPCTAVNIRSWHAACSVPCRRNVTMSRMKRLLVPTDFSPASDIAFNYALDLAAREGASIHLLHVVDDASYAAAFPDGMFVELPGLRERLVAEAIARLD